MTPFLLKLTWANLIARPLATALTIATLAAAVALISVLLQFSAHTSQRLTRDLAGVDLVVGAKGSPLQLILSSLLHIDVPTGNIPLSEAQKIMEDPFVESAVPLALGDSFRGFRIVGTSIGFLELYEAQMSEGSEWTEPQQVVIGAQVASQLGMQVGQRFVGAHGLSFSDADLIQHDHAAYEVVGILAPHTSIVDQLIITSVDSVWHAHEELAPVRAEHADDHEDHGGHDDDHEDHETEQAGHEEDGHHDGAEHTLSDLLTMDADERAITALLVAYNSPIAAVRMPRAINDQPGLQAASPALEITRLYNLSAGLMDAGRILAVIMTVIGGLSIFVAVSNAAAHKIYDIALLRAMGAIPRDVFLQQIFEGVIVASTAGLLGIAAAHVVLLVASFAYAPLAVFGLNGSEFFAAEAYLLLGTVLVGIVAVIWPALNSYKIDPMMLLKGAR